MSYQSIMQMASNQSLISRIAACAAEQGVKDHPIQWAQQNAWSVCSTAGWASAWDSAEASYSPNVNPDTGLRNDVITDQMILSAVQPMVAV